MFSVSTKLLVAVTLAATGSVSAAPVASTAGVAAPGDWSAPATVSPTRGADLRTAVSPAGEMAVVWARQGNLRYSLRAPHGDWSPPALLVKDGYGARIAYDGAGRLLVVYAQDLPGSRPRIAARTHDPVQGWAPAVVVARRDVSNVFVEDVAVNASGEAVVGWTADRRGLVSRGGTSGPWATASWPKVVDLDVALGDGGLAAVMLYRFVGPWQDNITLTYEIARQPRGGDWGSVKVLQTIEQSPPWAAIGSVAVDAFGTTTAAWEQQTRRGFRVMAIRATQGHRWRDPVVLSPLVGTEVPVTTLATPEGDVVALWVNYWGASSAGDLSGARRPAHGTWTRFTEVCPGRGIVLNWDAALDPSGRAVVGLARANSFDWSYGSSACLMNARGTWSAAQRLTQTIAEPVVGMGHGEAVFLWSGSQGLRARTHS